MRVGDEPYVIEYNVRMGDPETEAVLPRIETDLLSHFIALGAGNLKQENMQVSPQGSTTIMMVSGGYPESYGTGKEIKGLKDVGPEATVFQAGTRQEGDKIVSSGGRVLTVTSLADTLGSALQQSYDNVARIYFDGRYYRKDIGYEISG